MQRAFVDQILEQVCNINTFRLEVALCCIVLDASLHCYFLRFLKQLVYSAVFILQKNFLPYFWGQTAEICHTSVDFVH